MKYSTLNLPSITWHTASLLFCGIALSGTCYADSMVTVKTGDITQQSTGSHIRSEINIGSARSDKTGDLNIRVSVGDVTALARGRGNKSTINLGSANGADTTGFKSKVIIGGKVVLDTHDSDGEINIGSQLDR